MSEVEPYILSLDQGTTSSRAILFNHAGRVCHIAQREYALSYPEAGWVEQDPEEIWESQREVMQEVLQHVSLEQVKAVGITNQRETVLLWERETGRPIYPAINWQDRRTQQRCEELKNQGMERIVQQKTGLRLDPYFSGTKVQWILDEVEGAREKAERGELCAGTVDTWLLWKLTGGEVHATDYSNASRTLLYNIHDLCWDTELLELFQIPVGLLPEVRETSGEFGRTPEGLPITSMAGDQQAALFGQGCFQEGMVKNTYGTGCFMLMQTGERAVLSEHGLLTTIGWKINGQLSYALEGSVFTAGATVKWLRDGLGIIATSAECEERALEVPDNGGVCFIPAFSGLGAPYWNDEVRGTLSGVTAGVDKRHICRATLEAVALQSYDLVKSMEADAGLPLSELRVDGGMTQSALLMEIQAELLDAPLVLPQEHEVTALGAAYLAGLAVDFWNSQEEISTQWEAQQRYVSRQEKEFKEKLLRQWERALEVLVTT